MGYSPDWQKQNYAKNNSTPKITQKGNIVRNELFHNAPSRLGLADGGDVTEQLKREGLEASNREREAERANMSGLEKFVDGFKRLGTRLKEGNIDQPGSAAYNKYGAGRGMMERDMKTPTNNEFNDYSGRNMSTLDEGGNIRPPVADTYPDEADRGVKPSGGIFSNPTMKGRGDDAPDTRSSDYSANNTPTRVAKTAPKKRIASPKVDDGMDRPHSTLSSVRSDSQSFPRNDDDMNRRRLAGTSKDPDLKKTSSPPSNDQRKKTGDDFSTRYAMRNVSPAEDTKKNKGKPDNSFSTRYAMRNS
jgi:hypothetical protein